MINNYLINSSKINAPGNNISGGDNVFLTLDATGDSSTVFDLTIDKVFTFDSTGSSVVFSEVGIKFLLFDVTGNSECNISLNSMNDIDTIDITGSSTTSFSLESTNIKELTFTADGESQFNPTINVIKTLVFNSYGSSTFDNINKMTFNADGESIVNITLDIKNLQRIGVNTRRYAYRFPSDTLDTIDRGPIDEFFKLTKMYYNLSDVNRTLESIKSMAIRELDTYNLDNEIYTNPSNENFVGYWTGNDSSGNMYMWNPNLEESTYIQPLIEGKRAFVSPDATGIFRYHRGEFVVWVGNN